MLVIPSIGLRGGKCASAQQGDPASERIYEADPVDQAKAFVAAGARQLHVVDLDGAFGYGENADAIGRICRAVDVPVQTGGGIRSLTHAKARLDAGAAFVILGTLLVEDERVSRNIVHQLGDRVFAGVDARGTAVAVRGWQSATPVDLHALVQRVVQWGIGRIVFTEIGRYGMGKGYDVATLREVAQAGEIRVTASGGAATVEDIKTLAREAPANVDACIVGHALYDGTIDLAQAIAAVA